MAEEKLIKSVVQSIFKAVPLTEQQWRQKIIIDNTRPSISSISTWKNGSVTMREYYRKAFVTALVSDTDLAAYEDYIRETVVRNLGIPQYRQSYYILANKSYEKFLNYVLFYITLEFIQNKKYDWSEISVSALLKLAAVKVGILSNDIRFTAKMQEDPEETLVLSYRKVIHREMIDCKVSVRIFFEKCSSKEFELFCQRFHNDCSESVVNILFVTDEVTDEVYFKAIKDYHILIRQIDSFDVDAVDSYRSYVPSVSECQGEEMTHFLNRIAEVIMKKICEMNHLILKEILCRYYDFTKVGKGYFTSNAGIWEYRYPIRRALAFEEDFLTNRLKEAAQRGYGKSLELLDINLTGALYGLRLSSRLKRVTCVDLADGSVRSVDRIIEKYNEEKEPFNEGIQNVQTGYLRMDNLNIIGVKMPENGFDMIVIGLGGASYINDLSGFLRKISGWLKMDGTLFISVYNQDALCRYSDQLENMDFTYNGYYFRHQGGQWHLPAILYPYSGIYNTVLNHYDIEESYSYPTMLSLISAGQDDRLLEKLKEIDKKYTRNVQCGSDSGMFNMICARGYDKSGILQNYKVIRSYLTEQKIAVTCIRHEEITSRDIMLRALNSKGIVIVGNFVKTILIYDKKNKIYFFMIFPLEKKFSRKILKQWYDKHPEYMMASNKIKFCSEKELKEFGLTSGSLSPFAYPVIREMELAGVRPNMILLYDQIFETAKFKDIFTYSGNLGMTYKLPLSDFLEYLKREGGITFE